ncbi:hypothetical protein HY572_06515 [Candidatus Micrarchaeota archaeon]|nr:hypothetical protein [Candidatus Micrarchaeota archaeon]
MRTIFIGLLVISVLMAFFLGYASNVSLQAQPEFQPLPAPAAQEFVSPPEISRKVTLELPAVDRQGSGALASFSVEVKTGSGKVYIGVNDSPLVNADTQSSLRIALDVAKNAASGSTRNLDVFYSFSTESDVVGGRSAGAAATVATMAALRGEKLRSDVLFTGTVEADGRIGPVGKILEKAQAVRQAGYPTLLVPVGESTQNVVVEECRDRRVGNTFVRECSSTTKKVDVSSQVPGLTILEVENVLDAYNLMKVS